MKAYSTKLVNEKVEFIFIKKRSQRQIMVFAHYLN